MNQIRIVPHRPSFCNYTWFKVQVKKHLLEIGRFRLFVWRTVGDYTSFGGAYACASDIKSAVNFNIANGKE